MKLQRPGHLSEYPFGGTKHSFDGFFDKGFSRIVGTLNLHSLLPQFFPPPPEPEEPEEPDDEDDAPTPARSGYLALKTAYSRCSNDYWKKHPLCKVGQRRRRNKCRPDTCMIPFPKGAWKNCPEMTAAFREKGIPEQFAKKVCKDLKLSNPTPAKKVVPPKAKPGAKSKPKPTAAKPKPKGPSPEVLACMKGAKNLLDKGMITRARFPRGIRAYCDEKSSPKGLGEIEKKNKLPYIIGPIILGSIAVSLLGRPTLAHLFSSSLEMQLWDTSEVIRDNVIAIAVIFAGMSAASRLPKFKSKTAGLE